MAVSTTPLTLEANQEISVKAGKASIPCYNDSGLLQQHFRNIPNDGNPQWIIKWANIASVRVGTKGEYAIAVQVYESLFKPLRTPFIGSAHFWYPEMVQAGDSGTPINLPDIGTVRIFPKSVYLEGDYAIFKKIVWVRNSDLELQSAAEIEADRLAEEKKQADELEKLKNGKPPVLGNNDTPKSSSFVWIILGVLLILIGGIWALISGKKKRDKIALDAKQAGNQAVNIIRIPKNT